MPALCVTIRNSYEEFPRERSSEVQHPIMVWLQLWVMPTSFRALVAGLTADLLLPWHCP